MILVAGATGLVGREVCRLLLDKKKTVRAMVRKSSNADVVNDLKKGGAQITNADLKDRASVDAAMHGVDAVISTATSTLSRQEGDSIDTVDRQGQITLIDSAKAAGVKRFVPISFNHHKSPTTCALVEAKSAAEQRLVKSGMDYTILRASFFMEIWLSPNLGFDAANAKATIYGSGENPISWISLFDVAAFAAAAVETPSAKNQIIEIGGPDAVSPNEVVRIFEQQTGRKFDVQHVPEAALQAQRNAAPDPMSQSFATLMLYCAKGDAIDMSTTSRQFSVRPKSVRDFAKAVTAGR